MNVNVLNISLYFELRMKDQIEHQKNNNKITIKCLSNISSFPNFHRFPNYALIVDVQFYN